MLSQTQKKQNELEVQFDVQQAARRVSPYWPVRNFIAVNGLQGLEDMPFREALRKGSVVSAPNGFAHFRQSLPIQDIAPEDLDRSVLHELERRGEENFQIRGDRHSVKAHHVLREWLSIAEGSLTATARSRPQPAQLRSSLEQLGARGTLAAWLDFHLATNVRDILNSDMIKWCSAFFDEGQALWTMPGRRHGFYSAWRTLARHDRRPQLRGVRDFKKRIENLPSCADEALQIALNLLGVSPENRVPYLTQSLSELSGWAGFIKYRSGDDDYVPAHDAPASLTDYLAVRLTLESIYAESLVRQRFEAPGSRSLSETLAEQVLTLANQSPPSPAIAKNEKAALNTLIHRLVAAKHLPDLSDSELEQNIFNWLSRFEGCDLAALWLEAAESTFRQGMVNRLRTQAHHAAPAREATRPLAQSVFCIDVRSEGFRRGLESQNGHKTFGFAGFFAFPIEYRELGALAGNAQCPVLIKPKYHIAERAGDLVQEAKTLRALKRLKALKASFREVKQSVTAAFSFVESLGGFFALPLILKSFFPRGFKRLTQRIRSWMIPQTRSVPCVQPAPEAQAQTPSRMSGIPPADQIAVAEAALRSMGLTADFGRFVVFCGHGGQCENNPFASSLDCGACGGHKGAPNARVAALVFNNAEVRAGLAQRGLVIPEDTYFLAAEHNTTTDETRFFDIERLPDSKKEDFKRLEHDFVAAGDINRLARLKRMQALAPSSPSEARREVERRSLDWSEVRPELGLAGNAGFIVAKRELTEKIDLEGRCFLHSYDWEQDANGRVLEGILCAPMVVTQWINNQYLFSSLDNARFGSGNKALHNIVGRIGVMEGNESDLRVGLPWQSVSDGQKLAHMPIRLLVTLRAPTERIAEIVRKHEHIRKLVDYQWLQLMAWDPQDERFYLYQPGLRWQAITSECALAMASANASTSSSRVEYEVIRRTTELASSQV